MTFISENRWKQTETLKSYSMLDLVTASVIFNYTTAENNESVTVSEEVP